jgi:diguanylate cyclase (GGDEF)-like protein/PAS domain S-box-containing protein
LLGVVPRPGNETLDKRAQLSELIATQLAAAPDPNDLAAFRVLLSTLRKRNPDLLSAALRSPQGDLVLSVGDHRSLWRPEPGETATATHVRIPLYHSGKQWRTLELRFDELHAVGVFASALANPLVHLLAALGGVCFVSFVFFMSRTLRHLDPSAVIPARLQSALDVMAEGVVILDRNEEVVLANSAFAARCGRPGADLLGSQASQLDWRNRGDDAKPRQLPWTRAIRTGQTIRGDALRLFDAEGNASSLVVNCSPVLDGSGRAKGAIVTLNDVTELEKKSQDLSAALTELEKSRDEIRLHNEELQVLATTDPLTGIANRRSFFEEAENALRVSSGKGRSISFIMGDIDHFKKVNDSHGHATGDAVIKAVAQAWRGALESNRLVCRYGGEEFCIRLDGIDSEAARAVAEGVRQKISEPGFTVVPITSSFGVFTLTPDAVQNIGLKASGGAKDVAEAINRADQALYTAKHAGRNRVVVWTPGLKA